jgi:CRISPR-associated protein Csb1
MSDTLGQYDDWVKEDSNVAALTMRQWLEPVEGKDAAIFPPTYPIEQNSSGYNIDRFEGGFSVCQIDSVGSQANRMEPIFKRKEYQHLVPQMIINAGQHKIHLLDAGHRAADAIARFSTLGPELHEAFRAFCRDGNAEKLARIAPTSIVFGSWDSRATQAKLPRIVRSVIRAFDVDEMHRSAQYSTIAGEILEGGEAEVTTKGPKAELGLAHVPAVMTPGGVRVRGDIRCEAVLNLVPVRALGSASGTVDDDLKLRRYILGLALVAFTTPQENFLREGCLLVPDATKPPQWKAVKKDGTREKLSIEHHVALTYATEAAKEFGIKQPTQTFEFDNELAKQVMGLSEKERKELLKSGAVTRDSLQRLKQSAKRKTEKDVSLGGS